MLERTAQSLQFVQAAFEVSARAAMQPAGGGAARCGEPTESMTQRHRGAFPSVDNLIAQFFIIQKPTAREIGHPHNFEEHVARDLRNVDYVS